MTDWCFGSEQVKWLTDVVEGGKSNDWLMQWCSNALSLALALKMWATWRNFRYLIFHSSHCTGPFYLLLRPNKIYLQLRQIALCFRSASVAQEMNIWEYLAQIALPTLSLKSRGDITKSPKRGPTRNKSFLCDHWCPCFGLLVTSPLGFKASLGNLICTWLRHTWESPLVWHLLTAWRPV